MPTPAQVIAPAIEQEIAPVVTAPAIAMGPAVCDDGANVFDEQLENHDPEEWNIHNDTESNRDDIVLSEEDDEDIKNEFDVCRWGVEYTPAMQKEFENADQTNIKRASAR